MGERIPVLYIGHDDAEIYQALVSSLIRANGVSPVCVGGDHFPFALGLLSHPAQPFKVVVLHMLAGCHELGFSETDENHSTGLRRAEIMRERGYTGGIVMISTNSHGLLRRVIADFDERVRKVNIHFISYSDIVEDKTDYIISEAARDAAG